MMKTIIKYILHEPHVPDAEKAAPLHIFLYDLPQFLNLGICPPRHILNRILSSGGGDAGMTSSASWVPFALTSEEYKRLLPKLLNPNPVLLKKRTRCGHIVWQRDAELDEIQGLNSWLEAVARKYSQQRLEETTPDLPTLFLSVVAPGGGVDQELPPLPLPRQAFFTEAGHKFDHPPGTHVLAVRTVSVSDACDVEVQASVCLSTHTYNIHIGDPNGVILQVAGKYEPCGLLFGPDIVVRLPEGAELSVRIFGSSATL